MTSPRRSEPLDLERDVPTTAADVAALARLRPPRRSDLLRQLGLLQTPHWLPPARVGRRGPAEPEPFEL